MPNPSIVIDYGPVLDRLRKLDLEESLCDLVRRPARDVKRGGEKIKKRHRPGAPGGSAGEAVLTTTTGNGAGVGYPDVTAEISSNERRRKTRERYTSKEFDQSYVVSRFEATQVNNMKRDKDGLDILCRVVTGFHLVCLADGKERSVQQQYFHQAMIGPIAKVIFGDRVTDMIGRIEEKFNTSIVPDGAIIRCERRAGKSQSLGMAIASCMMFIPGMRVVAVATKQDTSTELANIVGKYMMAFISSCESGQFKQKDTGISLKEVTMTSRTIKSRLSYVDGKDERAVKECMNICKALPPNKLRGTTANLVLYDEADFVPPPAVTELAPLQRLSGTSVIFITSASSRVSITEKLSKARFVTGELIFATCDIKLVCPECLATRKRLSEVNQAALKGKACEHRSHLEPRWFASRGGEITARLMQATGDADLVDQETLNITSPEDKCAFTAAARERLLRPAIYRTGRFLDGGVHSSQYLCLSLDPGYGRSKSACTIFSFNHDSTVVFLGYCQIEHADPRFKGYLVEQLLEKTYNMLPILRSVPVITTVEANVENNTAIAVAHSVGLVCKRYEASSTIFLAGNVERGGGVRTDVHNKNAMVMTLEAILSSDRLFFYEDFFTIGEGKYSTELMSNFRNDVNKFEKVVSVSPRGDLKISYSGKMNGDDDLVMSVLLCLFHSSAVIQRLEVGDRVTCITDVEEMNTPLSTLNIPR